MDLDQAVAIVGVGCRFPGGSDLDEFWEILKEGKCQTEEIRKDRWSIDAFYDSNKDAVGKTYAKHAAFIDKWDEWDNTFFGVNEAEAERMDPQHKIALECVYKATENAGMTTDDLSGSNTSVFMGQMNDDMARLSERDMSGASSYNSTGLARSLLANRVSYTYNLQGPSMTLDTACSAGLVAVHQGIRSILSGESDASICGGVTIIHSPSPFVGLSKAHMSSEAGKCHAFSDKADGYVRGEGCGVVVLKPIKKAKEDGDFIWGYIASAVNQDGRTVTPITAPSGMMQEKLLRDMYSKINIKPENIQYVEAHGTGTRAGDPVEIRSLGRVIGAAHDKTDPCLVGSVKTNIGHTESAAGIAGVIKVLLMMRHGKIVPSLHFDVPNPNIDLNLANLVVPTSVQQWQTNSQGARIAAVNSFGFGGTNAHAVLLQADSEHYPKASIPEEDDSHSLKVVTCSAKSREALKQSLTDLQNGIKSSEVQDPIDNLSYTSTNRRNHFKYRAAFTVKDVRELSVQLSKTLEKPIESTSSERKEVVFVFGGMGTHWSRMGMQLMQREKLFRDKMEEIDSIVQQHESLEILNAIRSDSDLSDPEIGQPAIFAIQVSLATLWLSWGVHPRAVIGHSVGEVAAAHIAGKLTLVDAIHVICTRGKLLSRVAGGSMLVIGNMTISDVKEMTRKFDGRVEVSAQNSPVNCTISGDEEDINAIEGELSALRQTTNPSLFLRKLRVKAAFHSHHIDPIVQPLGEALKPLSQTNLDPSTAIISTVTGKEASGGDFVTGRYWQKNVRQEVLFYPGLQTISNIVSNPVFIEISPKPALGRNIIETLEVHPSLIIPSMKEGDESMTIMRSLASIYTSGVDIDWKSFWGKTKLVMTKFPRYHYQRKRLYRETEAITNWRFGKGDEASVMGHRVSWSYLRPDTEGWFCRISKDSTPFVYDHRRAGKPLIPAAMYAEVGLSACIAACQNIKRSKNSVTNVSIINAFHLHQEDCDTGIHVCVDHQPEMPANFFRFFVKGGPKLLSKGNVRFIEQGNTNEILDVDSIKQRCTTYFGADELYGLLEKHKYTYGRSMRAIREGVKNETECLTKLVVPSEVCHDNSGFIIHPAILDSCLQLVAILFTQDDQLSLAVPVAIDGLMVLGDPMEAKWIYMNITYQTKSQSEFEAFIMDCNGVVLAKASRIVLKVLDKILVQSPPELCYMLGWIPAEIDTKSSQPVNASNVSHPNTQICHFYANQGLTNSIDLELERLTPSSTSIASDDMPTDLDKYFLEKNPAAILFSVGIPPDADSPFTESDLAASEQCCWSLLNILKYCSKSKGSIPVYVLTKHVNLHTEQAPWYGLPDLPQLSAKSCLVGSALLGLARTAVREGHRVVCIDMTHCNAPELKTISSLIEEGTSYPELVLVNDAMYRNEFLPLMGPTAGSHRTMRIRQDDMIQVVSTISHDSVTLHQSAVEPNHETKGQVQIIRARLHSDRLFPTQLKSKRTVASLINNESQPVLAFDYTVKTLPPNGHSECFGCQPVPLAEVVHVDDRTLVPVSLLPSEVPLLSLWLLSWDILKNHRDGSKHIRILNLANWHFLETCMRAVAKALNCRIEDDTCKVVTPLSIVLANNNMDTPYVLEQTMQVSERALVITSNADLRVTCGALLDLSLLRNVSFYSHVDLFALHRLVELVPKFKEWVTETPISKLQIPFKIIEPISSKWNEGVTLDALESRDKAVVLEMPKKGDQNTPTRLSGLTYRTRDIFKRNGCYILVGANKGMGLELLKHMASRGAGILIALSRNPPSDAVYHEYELLEKEHNVQVYWVETDATDINSLRKAFERIDQLRGKCPVKGVFQGAVVLADALLHNLTYEQFVYAYRVKVYGSFYLHCLTKDLELDYFVMHSSITGILGNVGQTAYGAANAFMNGFANCRRSRGLAGQTVNWSTLRYGIIQWNKEARRHLDSIGILPLENEEVWQCMEHTLMDDLTGITYGKFDLVKLIEKGLEEGFGIASRMTFLGNTAMQERKEQSKSTSLPKQPSHKASEARTSESKTKCYIVDIISEQLAVTADDLDGSHEAPLVNFGFHSMDELYVQSRIQEDFSIHIDIDRNSSLGSLAAELWSKLAS